MFSASKVGVALGAPQGYYRAGTPLLHITSEGPARLSLSLFTDTPPKRNLLLPRKGYATKVFLPEGVPRGTLSKPAPD
jgi:hypothetical protein